MKFKLKKGVGQVKSFTDAKGVKYLPGDVVELPGNYEGEAWLVRVDGPAKVEAPPAKLEAIAPLEVKTEPMHIEEEPKSPLAKPKKEKKAK